MFAGKLAVPKCWLFVAFQSFERSKKYIIPGKLLGSFLTKVNMIVRYLLILMVPSIYYVLFSCTN